MRSSANLHAERLPSRFPVGTRYVIEGRGGHIQSRYLEFPDGRQIQLQVQLQAKSPIESGGDLASRPRSRGIAGRYRGGRRRA